MKRMISVPLMVAAFTVAVAAGSPQNAGLTPSRPSPGTTGIAAGNPVVGKRRTGCARTGRYRQTDDYRLSRAARQHRHGDHRGPRRRLRRARDRARRTTVGVLVQRDGDHGLRPEVSSRPRYHHPIELGDAQRAIRTVRARAAEFNIMPDRIGMMGFSAGGHLTSTAGTHFDAGKPDASDPIERVGSRPDFLILGYPVISFDPAITHAGSLKNLLGENPDPKLVENLSNESAGHRADTANIHLPHDQRQRRPGREQRPLLPRVEEGQGAGRDASVRKRAARRRHGALGSVPQCVAWLADELVEGAGLADKPNP